MTREETIEEIKSWTPILLSSPNLSDKAGEVMDMAISALSENKGEWITKYEHKMCNKCGHTPPSDDDHYYILSNFCPNCGADMRGE